MQEVNESSIFDLAIDNDGSASLAETAKWAKVVAIFGLIGGVIIVLAGLVIGLMGSTIYSSISPGMGAAGPIMGVFFAAIGAIMIVPNWKLLKFGSSMSPGLRKNDQIMVNDALRNLKAYFKIMGIFMLVVIGIYVVFFVGAMTFGSFMK